MTTREIPHSFKSDASDLVYTTRRSVTHLPTRFQLLRIAAYIRQMEWESEIASQAARAIPDEAITMNPINRIIASVDAVLATKEFHIQQHVDVFLALNRGREVAGKNAVGDWVFVDAIRPDGTARVSDRQFVSIDEVPGEWYRFREFEIN